MRLYVRTKTGLEGTIVGYAPGKKGQPVAILLVGGKLHSTKLRSIEVLGMAKLVPPSASRPQTVSDLLSWSAGPPN